MKIQLDPINRLKERINGIFLTDSRPLMFTWMKILDDGNRKGVLAGTDGQGRAMEHVRYRPVDTKKGKGAKLTAAQKNNVGSRQRRGVFGGFGPLASGLNNNLTSAEYRKLDGPPLAPRGAFSRVITNFVTRYYPDGPNARVAEGSWRDVVSTKGVEFLGYHFNGEGRLPVRDLRGVRPDDVEKARKAAVNWMRDQIRTHRQAS